MIPYGVWVPALLNSQRLGAGTQAASSETAPVSAAPAAAARPRRARSSGAGPSDNPADGALLRWLPRHIARLYRALIHPVPYASGTRVREPAPDTDADITPSMWARYARVEIAQDAYCECRPNPKRLFRKPVIHRNLESWCDSTIGTTSATAAPPAPTSAPISTKRKRATGRPSAAGQSHFKTGPGA